MAMDMPAMPPRCASCAVRSRALCSVLSGEELYALNAASRQRHFEEGRIIVSEGEPGIIANIGSGILVEKKTLPDGREQIVSLLFPADFIAADLGETADTTVQAVSDVVLCTHDVPSFFRLMEGHPGLKQGYLTHARNELRNAREWMLLLGQKNAEERVATFLMRLATRQTHAGCSHYAFEEARDGMVVDIPITRAQIASFLGLTFETVSRRMRALESAGIIELTSARSATLRDVRRLRELSI